MRENNTRGKCMAVILIVAAAIAITTVSIAVPISIRAFYYIHIDGMDLTVSSGMTNEEIREAFDDVMDYCIGKSDTFAAGDLHWTPDGAAHFEDVRELFILDLRVAWLSCTVILAILLYCAARGRRPYLFRGHSPCFWSAAGIGTAMITVSVAAAVNFDKAFEIFHRVFFPGKDNWLLDPDTDPVITILPQEFFRNCTILIVIMILILCVAMLAADYVILYRNRRKLNRDVYKK